MSECAKVSQEKCLPPKCIYVNKTRKYCRKAFKQTEKLECKKLPQDQCTPPCVYINTEKRKYCRSKKSTFYSPNSTNPTKTTKKISTIIKQSKLFLKTMCKSSGECLAFGKYSDELNRLFNHFADFSYASGPIKKIGSESSNGFVREIKYEKDGYTAYSILKSSTSARSDNLVYEYIVGKHFINKIIKQFPCFLYTYGLYYYKTLAAHTKVKSANQYDATTLSDDIKVSTIQYDQMCNHAKRACILVQHLHNSVSLKSMIPDTPFVMFDLIYILFIIYQALYSLRTQFTHYDLHTENVLLCKLPENTCIQYVYHLSDKDLIFRLPYVPKIIDYGRCYFNAATNSQKIKDKLCATPECNPKCGSNFGFSLLNSRLKKYYIQPTQMNQSHDLRLLHIIKTTMKFKHTKSELYQMLSRVVYLNRYGTPENLNSEAEKILNVSDAYINIKEQCNTTMDLNVEKYKNHKVIQTLHIYENGKEIEYE